MLTHLQSLCVHDYPHSHLVLYLDDAVLDCYRDCLAAQKWSIWLLLCHNGCVSNVLDGDGNPWICGNTDLVEGFLCYFRCMGLYVSESVYALVRLIVYRV